MYVHKRIGRSCNVCACKYIYICEKAGIDLCVHSYMHACVGMNGVDVFIYVCVCFVISAHMLTHSKR